jgi:hypothetical protein
VGKGADAVGGSSYSAADIGQARQVIGAEAGKFGSVGDGIPQHVDAGMFGTLPNSAAVAQAVGALCSTLRTEYAKAETLVGAIERALDTNVTNSTAAEQNNRQSFQTQQV